MRNFPEEDYEKKELENLNAEKWMVDALKMNPDYNSWGNDEDYMETKKSGWNSAIEIESTNDLFGLDDLNELVNFHFEIIRNSVNCESCDGSGYNKATKILSDSWYSFDDTEWIRISADKRYNNKAWEHHLTEIEIEALVREGRLRDLVKANIWFDKDKGQWIEYINGEKILSEQPEYPTPETVNKWSLEGFGHDSINHFICVEARAKHLGVYGRCEKCNGKGYIHTEPKAHLALQLWYLHPRKGASRGVLLNNVKENEFNKTVEYLQEAAKRNANRFSRLQTI
jgi:hypothetical protein